MKKKLTYGWVITAGVFLVYIMNMGVPMYGASIINTKMALAEGCDIAVLGYSATVCGTVRAAAAAFGGRLVARLGARQTMLYGSLMAVLVSALLFFVPMGTYLRVIIYGLYGFSLVFGAILTTPVIIKQWFGKNSSLPMAIALSSGALAGMVTAPLVEIITGLWGWQSGWAAALICSLAAVLLAAFVLRDAPEEAAAVQPEKPVGRHSYQRRTVYYILASSYAIRTMLYMIFVSLAVVYMLNRGYSSAQGATALTALTGAGLLGRLIEGLLGRTRVPCTSRAFTACACMAVGCLLMLCASGVAFQYVGCALVGYGYGKGYILMPLMNGEFFDSAEYSSVTGEIITWGAVLGAAGPTAAVTVIARKNGYVFLLAGMAILCAASGVSNLLLKQRHGGIINRDR